MSKGKASSVSKAKTSVKQPTPAKPKPKIAAKPTSPKEKEPAPKPAPPKDKEPAAPAAAVGASGVGLKKRNVKRGAPPMLPRRMARRPDGSVPAPPSGPPAPPRTTGPGSLHAPARRPEGAENLKQRLGAVMGLVAQLRGLKRTLNRQFFEAGLILQKLSEPALFQAKGYSSFEKFVEREIERELSIGRSMAHDLVKIVALFQREPAEEIGVDRLRLAIRAIWPEPGPATGSYPAAGGDAPPPGAGQ